MFGFYANFAPGGNRKKSISQKIYKHLYQAVGIAQNNVFFPYLI